MHEVDQTTEQMVRSVLAYAENRLRMNPVPLDKGFLRPRSARASRGADPRGATPARRGAGRVHLSDRAQRALRRTAHGSSASSRPLRPRPACCSTCWCPVRPSRASPGRRPPERSPRRTACCGSSPRGGPSTDIGRMLRVRRVGREPVGARRCSARRKRAGVTGRPRVVVGLDAHSSIVNTPAAAGDGRAGGGDAGPPAHRGNHQSLRRRGGHRPTSWRWCAPRGRRTQESSTTSPGSARSPAIAAGGSTSTAPTAGRGASPSLTAKYDRHRAADSFIVDPHKWLFTPFDCCALSIANPSWPGRPTPRTRRTST